MREWREAGLYESQQPEVKAFLAFFEQHPELCWDEMIAAFREKHYRAFAQVVPPLLDIDDKLLRLALIGRADLQRRQELALVKTFIQQADPVNDERELLMIARMKHKGVAQELGKRGDLTPRVRRYVVAQPTPKMQA